MFRSDFRFSGGLFQISEGKCLVLLSGRKTIFTQMILEVLVSHMSLASDVYFEPEPFSTLSASSYI